MIKTLVLIAAALVGPIVSGATTPDNPVQVAGAQHFAQPKETLETLLRKQDRKHANHFCVLQNDDVDSAWVVWQEGRAIILWEPVSEGIANLRQSRRYLKFGRDIVSSDDPALETSIYLESKEWAADIIDQCNDHGIQFTFPKN